MRRSHTSDGHSGGRRDTKTVVNRAEQSLPYAGGKPIQVPGCKDDTIRVMFNLDHSPLRAMRAVIRECTSRVNKMIVLR